MKTIPRIMPKAKRSKPPVDGIRKSMNHYRGKQMNPKIAPMSRSHPYGWWEDAGKWIGGAGHSINQLVGGGDHKVGADRIKNAGKAVGGYLDKHLREARKHFLGFGQKTLPKVKTQRVMSNKTKTGIVNKHKYKKGVIMV